MLFQLFVLFTLVSEGFLENKRLISIKDAEANNKIDIRLQTRDMKDAVKWDPEKGIPDMLKKKINGPIKIIIHGYLENSKTPTANNMRKKFLEKSDVVTITVDWGKGSIFPIYWPVLPNVEKVGRHLGKALDWLVSQGANLKKIHIIGHSLGAHVAGIAGSSLKGGRKVARITGLDPALPGFSKAEPAQRLDASDADFVDVIHTCDELYGYPDPLGHADFYVNGGRHRQPGCHAIDLGICSHLRSAEYFTESIDPKHQFVAALCPKIPREGPSGCTKSIYLMGNYLSPKAKGIFYVQTSDKHPFALKTK